MIKARFVAVVPCSLMLALTLGESHTRAGLIVGNLTSSSDTVAGTTTLTTYIAMPLWLDGAFSPVGIESLTLRLMGSGTIAGVTLWSDNGSVPGSILADFGTQDISALADYTFLPSSEFVLQASTDYWVVLQKTGGNGNPLNWRVTNNQVLDPGSDPAADIPLGMRHVSNDSGQSWILSGHLQHMFSVQSVPGPATATLLALGAPALRRRRG